MNVRDFIRKYIQFIMAIKIIIIEVQNVTRLNDSTSKWSFQDIFTELEKAEPKVESLLSRGGDLLEKSSDQVQGLNQDLATLKARWDNINSRARERHGKLQEAANKADNFHLDLNKFISWLTSTEKNLNNLKAVSRVLHHINDQIEEHKLLQKDISSHREVMVGLDKTGEWFLQIIKCITCIKFTTK